MTPYPLLALFGEASIRKGLRAPPEPALGEPASSSTLLGRIVAIRHGRGLCSATAACDDLRATPNPTDAILAYQCEQADCAEAAGFLQLPPRIIDARTGQWRRLAGDQA